MSAGDVQNSGRYGWTQDGQGNLTPSSGPGAGGVLAQQNLTRAQANHSQAVDTNKALTGGGTAFRDIARGGVGAGSSPSDQRGTRFPGLGDMFSGGLGPGSGSGMQVPPQTCVPRNSGAIESRSGV